MKSEDGSGMVGKDEGMPLSTSHSSVLLSPADQGLEGTCCDLIVINMVWFRQREEMGRTSDLVCLGVNTCI